jgi:hypothetical protein
MAVMERLSGSGRVMISKTGDTIWRDVRYDVTIAVPDGGHNPYERVEVTLDVTGSQTTPQLELGERLTLSLEDGWYLDMFVCSQSTHGVDVLATCRPRRRLNEPDGHRRAA